MYNAGQIILHQNGLQSPRQQQMLLWMLLGESLMPVWNPEAFTCGSASSIKGDCTVVAKCFPLPTSITSVFLRFSIRQLFFTRELISSKQWASLEVVAQLCTVKVQ